MNYSQNHGIYIKHPALFFLTIFPIMISLSLTGCSSDNPQNSSEIRDELAANAAAATGNSVASLNTAAGLDSSNMFSGRDKEVGYEESTSTIITLSDNASTCNSDNVVINKNIITLQEEGTYILSGSLSNGQIIIDAGDTDKLQIVLNGVNINSSSSAALYVKQADKVFVTLAPGTVNTLSNSGEFASIDDNNIDAVLLSKPDLTLNGSGSLTVQTGYGHGIVSKDDLKITGGTYDISAASSTLSGKDSVRIFDGTFSLTAGKDAIHSENTDDAGKGFIYIAGGSFMIQCESDGLDASGTLQVDDGTFMISAGDDGFHSDNSLIINAGNITISDSYEGIEGLTVTINGGYISLKADDDGINAASGNEQTGFGWNGPGQKGFGQDSFRLDDFDPESFDPNSFDPNSFDSENFDPESFDPNNFDSNSFGPDNFGQSDCLITINGGILYINAGGDGIDSNGDIVITGGETYVSGPVNDGNGALDYEHNGSITGGIFVAVGSRGMAQNFSESSTQGSIMISLSSTASAGDEVTLTDSTQNILLSYTPEKTYNNIVVSCPAIAQGETYTITAGSQSNTVQMESLIYGNDDFRGGRGGRFGGGSNGMDEPGEPGNWGDKPDGMGRPGERGDRPDGMGEPGEPGNWGDRPDGMGEPGERGDRPGDMGEPGERGDRPVESNAGLSS